MVIPRNNGSNYELRYLDKHCNGIIYVANEDNNSTLFLKGSDGNKLPSDCNVTLKAPLNHGLIVTFIGEAPDSFTVVVDEDSSFRGGLQSRSLATSKADNDIVLQFRSNPNISDENDLQVVVTTFQFLESKLCPLNYYYCGDRRCIRHGLVCDSVNNCGNNSDESNCYNISMLGLIVFGMVLISMIGCVMMWPNYPGKTKRIRQCHVHPFPAETRLPIRESRDYFKNPDRSRRTYGTSLALSNKRSPPRYSPPPDYPGSS
jgi:hypothetical protein